MKKQLAVILLVLLASLATAPSKEARHPLSQIHPIDENLNMSNRAIFNASEIKVRNGLQLNGLTVEDSGDMDILQWDTTNNQWDILNGDLNLSFNELRGVGGTQCSSGEVLLGDGSCIQGGDDQDLSDVLGEGNSAGSYNIDMNNQNIVNLNEISNGSQNIAVGSPLDMAGDNILNPGSVDGIDLDSPGDGISINNQEYEIGEDSVAQREIDDTVRLDIQGIDLKSYLNMSGNRIRNVPAPQAPGDAVNKSYVDDNDDTIADDQNLAEVLDEGNSAVDDNIDLSENDLKRVRRLQFSDRNSDATFYNITESGGDLQIQKDGNQRLNVLKSGGVEVRNGDLNLAGNKIIDSTASNLVTLGDSTDDSVAVEAGGSGTVELKSGDGGSGTTTRISISSGSGESDIDVSNADVDLQGNSVTSSAGEVCIGDQCS